MKKVLKILAPTPDEVREKTVREKAIVNEVLDILKPTNQAPSAQYQPDEKQTMPPTWNTLMHRFERNWTRRLRESHTFRNFKMRERAFLKELEQEKLGERDRRFNSYIKKKTQKHFSYYYYNDPNSREFVDWIRRKDPALEKQLELGHIAKPNNKKSYLNKNTKNTSQEQQARPKEFLVEQNENIKEQRPIPQETNIKEEFSLNQETNLKKESPKDLEESTKESRDDTTLEKNKTIS